GLAPPRALSGRGPGAVLPDRDDRPGCRADRAGQGGLPTLSGDAALPGLGAELRSGLRCLGWPLRGRAAVAQAPPGSHPGDHRL
ncbi:MAG: WhiB-like transcription regulator, partial [uncultured Blastococcus sp.]